MAKHGEKLDAVLVTSIIIMTILTDCVNLSAVVRLVLLKNRLNKVVIAKCGIVGIEFLSTGKYPMSCSAEILLTKRFWARSGSM